MKIAGLFVAGMFLTTPMLADDAEDVKAAETDFRAKESAGNVDGYFAYKASTYSIFPPTRGLLSGGQSKERAYARFDPVTDRDMQIRNIDVQIYGNTAVSTYYLISTTQRPGVELQRRHLRMTGVWVKESGDWKVVHRHESPLVLRSTPSIEDRFVGTWRFVSIEQRNAQGELLPAISNRTGFIIYTPTGHMAVQLMVNDRKEFEAEQPSGEEARAALAGYNAYSGTFTVNEAEGTVTHHRQTKLAPGAVDALGGTDVVRSYRFSGNQLMLTPPTRMIDGQELTRTLIWERVE